MKAILTLLCILILNLGMSQNVQNEQQDLYLEITLIGPKTIEINNHQNCAADIEIKAEGITAISPNNKNSLKYVTVPPGKSILTYEGAPSRIEMKSLTVCTWKGEMPIWVVIPREIIALPVKFKSISAQRVDGGMVKITYSVENQINIKQYNVQVSVDGKNWITKTIVFPNNMLSNTNYSVTFKP